MSSSIEISKPFITDKEIQAVVDVLQSRNLSQGPVVKEFEAKFAEYCGTKYAVAVNNGTASLHCLLYAHGIDEGDEVITTPFTFVATANSILMQRGKVVFADIEDTTFNLDPKSVESKVTKKTKAVMPVSLYGHIYDVPGINAVAKRAGVPVIEDAAQSVGSMYKNKMSGNVSESASFSLYATKNLTAGVGGIITTNSKKIMEKCKLFRHHGQDESKVYVYKEFGYNYRMMDMIAAMALVQLERINELTDVRRKNANLLTELLTDVPGLVLPTEAAGYKHVYHQYTVRVTPEFSATRDKLIEHLEKQDIHGKIFYPKPLHLYPHLQKFGYQKGDFPVAERLSQEVMSLPVHPLVTEKEIHKIAKVIRAF